MQIRSSRSPYNRDPQLSMSLSCRSAVQKYFILKSILKILFYFVFSKYFLGVFCTSLLIARCRIAYKSRQAGAWRARWTQFHSSLVIRRHDYEYYYITVAKASRKSVGLAAVRRSGMKTSVGLYYWFDTVCRCSRHVTARLQQLRSSTDQ